MTRARWRSLSPFPCEWAARRPISMRQWRCIRQRRKSLLRCGRARRVISARRQSERRAELSGVRAQRLGFADGVVDKSDRVNLTTAEKIEHTIGGEAHVFGAGLRHAG